MPSSFLGSAKAGSLGPGTGQLTKLRLQAGVDDPEHVIRGLVIFLV